MGGRALRHGFKAEAERTAERIRQELGLKPYAPLPARRVLTHVGLTLFEPCDIGEMPTAMLNRLLVIDNQAWSAVTIEHPAGNFVIMNPSHSEGRQEADLMHESSHVICGHQPEPMTYTPGFPFSLRTYDERLEAEAECQGAALQLPRLALLWALERGMSNEDIAEFFTASLDMVRFRRDTTGVNRQMYYRSRSVVTATRN